MVQPSPPDVPPEDVPVVPPPEDVPVVPAAVELAAAPVDDAAEVAPTEELAFPEDEAAPLAVPAAEPEEGSRGPSPSTIWRQQPLEAPATRARENPTHATDLASISPATLRPRTNSVTRESLGVFRPSQIRSRYR